jgi:hypothetical protein
VNPFGGVAPVPNGVNADARQLTDADLWAGLDLSYVPYRAVKVALARGDEAGAQAALVAHFRRRRTPLITKYRTDPHWSDWEGGPSLIARADALAEFKVFEEGDAQPGAVAIVEEAAASQGLGPRIAASITERFFDLLDAPPCCLASLDVPLSVSKVLEDAAMIGDAQIVDRLVAEAQRK